MRVLFLTDGYKVDHRNQYPKGTTLVQSNWTPRSSRVEDIKRVVFFGLQYFIKRYLIEEFDVFFKMTSREIARASYQNLMNGYLGTGTINCDHISALHELGYLPIKIEAAFEGEEVPIRTPMFFIENTLPEFFWLTNYLETLLSATIWLPCTSATTAARLKRLLVRYADDTGASKEFCNWQGHDFSFRGMGSVESAITSGMAHLLSFTGTDTIPAIPALIKYYNADPNSLIGGSVAATEHSVMCMGEEGNEIDTFRRLIKDVYPKGIVSIVSDTWDYWKVITEYLPSLRDLIMSREGKVVIRPDSGDPVKIVCGDPLAHAGTPENLGTVRLLWELFGGTINGAGYKELDSHIGLIYGDGINYERMFLILQGLKQNGFASNNIVFGVGSYTYQYVTRDTYGFAMKATYGENNGQPVALFKNPKTDSGEKRSAKGLISILRDLRTHRITGHLDQGVRPEYIGTGYQTVFLDGKLLRDDTLENIRERLRQIEHTF